MDKKQQKKVDKTAKEISEVYVLDSIQNIEVKMNASANRDIQFLCNYLRANIDVVIEAMYDFGAKNG